MTILHAWFSEKQKNQKINHNNRINERNKPVSNIYLNTSGKEIEITSVSETEDHGLNTDYFDDIKYLGTVTEWVRSIY